MNMFYASLYGWFLRYRFFCVYFINIITHHKCVGCVYLCLTGFRKRTHFFEFNPWFVLISKLIFNSSCHTKNAVLWQAMIIVSLKKKNSNFLNGIIHNSVMLLRALNWIASYKCLMNLILCTELLLLFNL